MAHASAIYSVSCFFLRPLIASLIPLDWKGPWTKKYSETLTFTATICTFIIATFFQELQEHLKILVCHLDCGMFSSRCEVNASFTPKYKFSQYKISQHSSQDIFYNYPQHITPLAQKMWGIIVLCEPPSSSNNLLYVFKTQFGETLTPPRALSWHSNSKATIANQTHDMLTVNTL